MQAAGLAQYFSARTQIQVICIAQYDLCAYVVAQFAGMHTLDTAQGAYGHEYRSLNLTVVGSDNTGTGSAARAGVGFNFEFH